MSMSDSLNEGARVMPQHVPRRMRRQVVGTVSTAAALVMAALAPWLSRSPARVSPTLSELARSARFRIGSAVNHGALTNDAEYSAVLVQQFNK